MSLRLAILLTYLVVGAVPAQAVLFTYTPFSPAINNGGAVAFQGAGAPPLCTGSNNAQRRTGGR